MSQKEHTEIPTVKEWEREVGEWAGMNDGRVEMIQYRPTYIQMLEDVEEALQSAFPTIADTELRPKLIRAIEIIDLLTSDAAPTPEEAAILEEELGFLEIEMVRIKRRQFVEENDVRSGAIFNDNRVASEDHTTVIPPDWEQNVQ